MPNDESKYFQNQLVYSIEESVSPGEENDTNRTNFSKPKIVIPGTICLRSKLRRALENESRLCLRRTEGYYSLSLKGNRDSVEPILNEIPSDEIGEIETNNSESIFETPDGNDVEKHLREIADVPSKEEPTPYKEDIDFIRLYNELQFVLRRSSRDSKDIDVYKTNMKEEIVAPILNGLINDILLYRAVAEVESSHELANVNYERYKDRIVSHESIVNDADNKSQEEKKLAPSTTEKTTSTVSKTGGEEGAKKPTSKGIRYKPETKRIIRIYKGEAKCLPLTMPFNLKHLAIEIRKIPKNKPQKFCTEVKINYPKDKGVVKSQTGKKGCTCLSQKYMSPNKIRLNAAVDGSHIVRICKHAGLRSQIDKSIEIIVPNNSPASIKAESARKVSAEQAAATVTQTKRDEKESDIISKKHLAAGPTRIEPKTESNTISKNDPAQTERREKESDINLKAGPTTTEAAQKDHGEKESVVVSTKNLPAIPTETEHREKGSDILLTDLPEKDHGKKEVGTATHSGPANESGGEKPRTEDKSIRFNLNKTEDHETVEENIKNKFHKETQTIFCPHVKVYKCVDVDKDEEVTYIEGPDRTVKIETSLGREIYLSHGNCGPKRI